MLILLILLLKSLWKEKTGTCYKVPFKRFWKPLSWQESILFPPSCLPCWTQQKTCAPLCLLWCLLGCTCLPHLCIAHSPLPTHRYCLKYTTINTFTCVKKQKKNLLTIWETQDPWGTAGQLPEIACRQKVSGVLQRLLLLLRSACCCHPAAQWYVSRLGRARHILHKVCLYKTYLFRKKRGKKSKKTSK